MGAAATSATVPTPSNGQSPIPLPVAVQGGIKGDVVRCPHCDLRQYFTTNGNCRRCHQSLIKVDIPSPSVIPSAVPAPPKSAFRNGNIPIHVSIALVVWYLRSRRCHLGMREFAARMKSPRTFISKIENAKITPTITTMERLSEALGVEIGRLIRMVEYVSSGE